MQTNEQITVVADNCDSSLCVDCVYYCIKSQTQRENKMEKVFFTPKF